MIKHIHVVVNPVAGQEKPILGTLNRVFHPAGVDWDVKVTKEAGDARRYAQEAVKSGVDAVAVYGGDGTVMETASGLIGTDVPLAIFPGGTANVMSVELGIPGDLAQASALVCGEARELRKVDMGQVNDHNFLLRVGTGFEADLVEGAPREMKDRVGNLAYVISGFQALNNSKMTRYQLTLDGKEVEIEGITCMIANSGNVGQPGLTLAPDISVSDGLLDVIVIRAGDVGSILSVVASVITRNENAGPLQHWQAREIKLVSEPSQAVQADGEILGKTPVNIRVIPQAVSVIVPKPGAVAAAAAQTSAQPSSR
jgi:YegS/Rv2252/BmrU family lipid kinase